MGLLNRLNNICEVFGKNIKKHWLLFGSVHKNDERREEDHELSVHTISCLILMAAL
jgi:hypothetical protein